MNQCIIRYECAANPLDNKCCHFAEHESGAKGYRKCRHWDGKEKSCRSAEARANALEIEGQQCKA